MFRQFTRKSILSQVKFTGPKASSLFGSFSVRGNSIKELKRISVSVLDKQVEIMKNPKISTDLKMSDTYAYRHIGNSDIATQVALDFLKVKTTDELMKQVVPESIRLASDKMFKHNGVEL